LVSFERENARDGVLEEQDVVFEEQARLFSSI
jgi:hypothetical protein